MALSERHKVGHLALYSRILVILMQSFFNFLIPDHDAKVFSPPNIHRHNTVDNVVEVVLGGFRRWDAIYFLHIAEFGYTYENSLAFFPLFPFIVRVAANSVFFPLQYCMNYANVLLVSATIINIVCFIKTAKCLCDLTFKLFCDEQVAMKVVQLFCLNPASVFFSAPYSEALFAFLSFSGMMKVEENRFGLAACYFALSGATRSNGLLNIGFIWHRQLKNSVEMLKAHSEKNGKLTQKRIFKQLLKTALQAAFYMAIVSSPFFIYQYYTSTLFCNPFASYRDLPVHILNYGNTNHYKMPHTGISPWCRNLIPLSYSYVQAKHWELGFLAYYQLKQLPNFILALPVVTIGLVSIMWFLRKNLRCCVTLGLIDSTLESNKKTDEPVTQTNASAGFCCSSNFVYLVHMISLITFGMLYMHTQVLTRFICCSCPVFYFFLAWITTNPNEPEICNHKSSTDSDIVYDGIMSDNREEIIIKQHQANHKTCEDSGVQIQAFLEWENSLVNRLVYIYLHLYFFVGIAAFSNFLPWT